MDVAMPSSAVICDLHSNSHFGSAKSAVAIVSDFATGRVSRTDTNGVGFVSCGFPLPFGGSAGSWCGRSVNSKREESIRYGDLIARPEFLLHDPLAIHANTICASKIADPILLAALDNETMASRDLRAALQRNLAIRTPSDQNDRPVEDDRVASAVGNQTGGHRHSLPHPMKVQLAAVDHEGAATQTQSQAHQLYCEKSLRIH